jgi:8-oxo-dGTP diphosphatase
MKGRVAPGPPIGRGQALLRPAPNDRRYPPRPVLAVSIAVFRDRRVLLGRRTRAPLEGMYSLPGGVVEIGETLREAALRELAEEVGVTAQIIAFNDHVESIVRARDGVEAHYVIASFAGLWISGEARTSPEADDVVWVDDVEIMRLPTTPGLARIVARAATLLPAPL